MLEFKRLDIENFKVIDEYFRNDNLKRINNGENIICDHVFGTTALWRDFYNIRYAIVNDCAVLLATVGGTEMFTFPRGNSIPSALESIKNYAHSIGLNIYFCFISENDLHYFYDTFEVVFASEEEDWSDYVYNITDISEFPGRKFHRQKNHLNKFNKTYPSAKFHAMTADSSTYLRDYTNYWYQCYSDNSPMSCAEHRAIMEILDNWDIYSMKGGYISENDKILGLTIGESVDDTVFVHIEKADHTIPGAYQFLSTEFLKSFDHTKVKFVNREEDMGIDGLRKSKLALHPETMLKKYTLFCY